jgi:hypothetical protein
MKSEESKREKGSSKLRTTALILAVVSIVILSLGSFAFSVLTYLSQKSTVQQTVNEYVLTHKDELNGEQGEKGDRGAQGAAGATGATGSSGSSGNSYCSTHYYSYSNSASTTCY